MPPYQDLPKSLVLEFLGTVCLVVFAASTAITSFFLPGMNAYKEHVLIAATVGVVVGLTAFFFGKISGAHINPSVSLAHSITGIMPRRWFFPYFAVQILAAAVAGGILLLVFRGVVSPTHFGSTKIQNGATPLTGALLEVVGTFLLCYATLIASTKFKGKPATQATLSALTIFVLTVLIGPFTGASFNPARSLGPALASGIFENQIVFWIGPLVGSLLAGLVFLFTREDNYITAHKDSRQSSPTFEEIPSANLAKDQEEKK